MYIEERLNKPTWVMVILTFMAYYAGAATWVIRTFGADSGAAQGAIGGAILVGMASLMFAIWVVDA